MVKQEGLPEEEPGGEVGGEAQQDSDLNCPVKPVNGAKDVENLQEYDRRE